MSVAPAVAVETEVEVVPEIGKRGTDEEGGVSVAEAEVEAESRNESCPPPRESCPPPRATLLRVTRRGGARVENGEGEKEEISEKRRRKK